MEVGGQRCQAFDACQEIIAQPAGADPDVAKIDAETDGGMVDLLDLLGQQLGPKGIGIVNAGEAGHGLNRQIAMRLQATESIVNRIYVLMTGREWDLMMAARGLSRPAAELIVRQSTVDTLGNDVAWPLLVEQSGLTLGYVQADGLIYETNTVYARNVQDTLDDDPEAWMLRIYAANQQVDAMRPFLKREQPLAADSNQIESQG